MTTKEGDFVNTHTQAASQMTEEPIWKRILFFALPLMVGNLFQQLYNTVDNIVVGNLGGKDEKKVSRVLSGVRHFVTHQKRNYSFIYRYGGDFF